MARRLTDKGVAALKARAARYATPDPEVRGHWIRIQPSGARAFYVQARDPSGKQHWCKIADADVMSIGESRERAREIIKRLRAGMPAVDPPPVKPDSVGDVADRWLKRHVRANGLRWEREATRLLQAHILPAWKDRPFTGIRRSDITALLDEIEDDHGARQADHVLGILSGIMNFHALRSDDYTPPVTRGMRRIKRKERARARVLDDSEITAMWNAADSCGVFGSIAKLALLTAQRREKLATMKWSDVSIDGTWIIQRAQREKGTPHALRLPKAALDIIRGQPRFSSNEHVFAGRAGQPFNSFSRGKAALDALMPEGTPQWQTHDLRRSARSLMARAGIRPDIAERVLGHAVGSAVAQTYDRHAYAAEMAAALERLAAMVQVIVNPVDNVVPMHKR